MELGLPDDAPAILKKAFSASYRLRYSGERVVTFRRGPERKTQVEYVIKNGSRIRIEFPDDSAQAGQIIVENRGERHHYFPALKEIHVGPAFFENAFERLRVLLKKEGSEKVRIETGNGESIAGIRTTAVTFRDQKGTLIQRLWIDERTGMMLKREMYDPVGTPAVSFEFKKVNLNPSFTDDEFKIVRSDAKVITAVDMAMKLIRENGMLPAFLKERGYKLFTTRMMGRTSSTKVLIQTYQTGLAPLSLVQVSGDLNEENLKRLAGRLYNIYSWTLQGRTFALIGDMPVERLKKLATEVEVKRES